MVFAAVVATSSYAGNRDLANGDSGSKAALTSRQSSSRNMGLERQITIAL
jgi:hypothetical protein